MLIFASLALVFDFLDGTAARVLKTSSTIGKELDSLADMVSFGVAPALVLFNYWQNENLNHSFFIAALLIAAFSAYRLAKFNSMEQSKEYFVGLPTPMFSIACFAIPMAAEQVLWLNTFLNNPLFIVLFVLIGSYLLISNIKLLSIKIGSENKTLNTIRVSMFIVCIILIIWLKFFGLFLCLLVYLVFSLTGQRQFN